MHAEDVRSVLDLIALPIPDFVNASYHLLLGRYPAPLELNERSGAVREGLGRARFLSDMSRSAEFREHHDRRQHDGNDEAFVKDAFLRYLDRWPDTAGLGHYTALLTGGRSRRHILRDISHSREARIRRTFWYELEQLLADERAERHWVARWIGKAKRRERQRNRMSEALSQRSLILQPTIANDAIPQPAQVRVVRSFGDTQNMGRNARQVLSRVSLSGGTL